jgi:hypothetical protein
MMSGLLLGMVLSVCTCWFHNTVTLPTWLVSTDFGTCSYVVPEFTVPFYPQFLTYIKVQSSTHSTMSLDVLFFCQYWARWHNVVCCLLKLVIFIIIIIIVIITNCMSTDFQVHNMHIEWSRYVTVSLKVNVM